MTLHAREGTMMAVDSGWYPAPDGASLLVWWDGQQWTGHTQPMPDWHQQQMLAETRRSADNSAAMRKMITGLVVGAGLVLLGLQLAGKLG